MKPPSRRLGVLGCGWLGLPLAARLVASGREVVGTTTRPERLALLTAAGCEARLLRLGHDPVGSLAAFLDGLSALVVNVPPGRNHEVEERYRRWFVQLAEAIALSGLRRVILVSTTSVYGPTAPKRVTEQTPLCPSKAAGRAALNAERLLAEVPDLALTVLRPAGLIGPGRHPGRFLAGKTELPDGAAPVNLVHRDDVVTALVAILDGRSVSSTYLLAAPSHPLRHDFYPLAAARLGLAAPTFAKGNGGEGHVICADLAERELGLRWRFPDLLATLHDPAAW